MTVPYRNKKIIGKNFESQIITLDKFKYILNKNIEMYVDIYKKSIFNIFKSSKFFRKAMIHKQDRFYKEYFFANSIQFYYSEIRTNRARPYLGKFYFLAEINDELEIVSFKGSYKEIDDIIDNLEVVTDKSIIKKIENSFEKIYQIKLRQPEQVYTDIYDDPDNFTTRKIKQEEITNISKLLALFVKRETINEVSKMLKNSELENETELIDKPDYLQIINIIIEETANKNYEFIVGLDGSFPLDEFRYIIEGLLKNNFFKIKLNNLYDEPSEFGIMGTEVFRDFDKDLKKEGLQLGFFDTQSDNYIMFIHKIDNREEIEKLSSKLGLNYFGSEEI